VPIYAHHQAPSSGLYPSGPPIDNTAGVAASDVHWCRVTSNGVWVFSGIELLPVLNDHGEQTRDTYGKLLKLI
jgi:hypothetical protein